MNGKDRKFGRSRKLEAGSFSGADVSVFFHFQARFPFQSFWVTSTSSVTQKGFSLQSWLKFTCSFSFHFSIFFYFQKGFQRNQMCVINNFHKLRRSVGTQCFFTFLRHSVPTERNKRIQIYSTRITFLRKDF